MKCIQYTLPIAILSSLTFAQTMQLDSDNRRSEVSTSFLLLDPDPDGHPDDIFVYDGEIYNSSSFGAYNDWVLSETTSGSLINSSLTHNSTVSNTAFTADTQAAASSPIEIDGKGRIATFAINDFSIEFTLTETTSFYLTAQLDASGPNASSYINIEQSGFGSIYNMITYSGELTIDDVVLLGPGSYEFTAFSKARVDYNTEYMPGTIHSSSSFTTSFSVIPSPSAATTLALFGLMGARRRR